MKYQLRSETRNMNKAVLDLKFISEEYLQIQVKMD